MSAREDVLARIAEAHRAAPPPELAYAGIERGYRTTSAAEHDDLVERLVDRLRDYKALVRTATPETLASVVAAALAERQVARLVVPDGLDPDWTAQTDATLLHDPPDARLSVGDLDAAHGVLTGCAIAIAETGTLVLDGSPGQGRRAVTLVPDYHLCVVEPSAVCADVPQAVSRLDLTRPITMISGPSATSDIELNRVEGVHGPRTLEVIVLTGDREG